MLEAWFGMGLGQGGGSAVHLGSLGPRQPESEDSLLKGIPEDFQIVCLQGDLVNPFQASATLILSRPPVGMKEGREDGRTMDSVSYTSGPTGCHCL